MKQARMLALFVCSATLLLLLPGRLLWAQSDAKKLLVLGDSLSAAYHMPDASGWVQLLQQRIDAERQALKVINASVSGETTQGGLARLPALLDMHRPDIVVVELGGNDGLQRLSLERMKQNLAGIVVRAKSRGARVLLIGVQMPPGFETRYQKQFGDVYRAVAAEQDVLLVGSILDGMTHDPTLLQEDRVHPNSAAQPRILANVWPRLEQLLLAHAAVNLNDAAPAPATTPTPTR